MPTPRPWTVLPHDALCRHAENLWSVGGTLPTGSMLRRMAIARYADGRLALFNAVPLSDPDMAAIEAFGEPAFLIVPSGLHRLDIHAFKARYPKLKLVCPAAVAGKVGQSATVDGDLSLLPDDPTVRAEPLCGTKIGEPVVIVKHTGATSLIFGDAVFNLPRLGGLDGALFGLLGSTGGPRVTRIARLFLVGDKATLRAELLRLAALPGLARWIPSHGAPVEEDAAGVLVKVAEAL